MKINSLDITDFDFKNNEELATLIQEWLGNSSFIKAKSSGSTGEPKTIELPKHLILNSAKLTSSFFEIPVGANALLALPLSFIAGKMMVFRSLVNDWNLILTDSSANPHLPEGNIHFAAFTPLQADILIETQFEKFNQIGTVILGGGAISTSLFHKLKKCRNRIFATYGMTETITHVAVCELMMQEQDQVFEALPGVEFFIDERGCLCIQAAHLDGGMFVTNDLVDLLDKTHFKFLGRIDNVINSAGLKIFPEKLEREIEEYLDCPFYVTSVEDELLGQKVVLFIQGEEKLFSGKLENLNSYFGNRIDRPRAYFFRQNFNYTHTGKVIKKYFE